MVYSLKHDQILDNCVKGRPEKHSFGCLYKVVPNGAARANSTHPSQLSEPQKDPNVRLE